jgi:dihydropyrimidinase
VAEQLDLVIKNGTLVLGGGSYKMAVGIKDGKVAALGQAEFLPARQGRN